MAPSAITLLLLFLALLRSTDSLLPPRTSFLLGESTVVILWFWIRTWVCCHRIIRDRKMICFRKEPFSCCLVLLARCCEHMFCQQRSYHCNYNNLVIMCLQLYQHSLNLPQPVEAKAPPTPILVLVSLCLGFLSNPVQSCLSYSVR